VVILCASFARNVAYFRAGQSQIGSAARAPSHVCSAFWTQVSANFLDISVLEWCKLLGDEKDKHFWRNIVADPAAFEASLLANLGMTASDFVDLAKKMRRYRDKFVAHLDFDAKMDILRLTAALAANSFYHGHIVRVEAAAGDLLGLPTQPKNSRKATSNASRKPSERMVKQLRTAMSRTSMSNKGQSVPQD
jgi:hypothetical protein